MRSVAVQLPNHAMSDLCDDPDDDPALNEWAENWMDQPGEYNDHDIDMHDPEVLDDQDLVMQTRERDLDESDAPAHLSGNTSRSKHEELRRQAQSRTRANSGTEYASDTGSNGSPNRADSQDDQRDRDTRPRASSDAQSLGSVDASAFPDYNAAHFGKDIVAIAPMFKHGSSTISAWQSYDESGPVSMRPVRTMCYNLPVEIFDRDGQRFRNWSTPHQNAQRASNIAAILGMAFTPTSKGFLSGNHEEEQRNTANATSEADKRAEKTKISRVYRYAFVLESDNRRTAPMFVIAYQELYNTALTEVTAIRIWKFVFDKAHSDSELWSKLMNENLVTCCNAGQAHCQNEKRNRNLVNEHKQTRIVSGGVSGGYKLERFCAMRYATCTTETQLFNMLKSFGGWSMHDDGLPNIDYSALPSGFAVTKIQDSRDGLGGSHPLSPEYVFNARREQAFRAGLVDFSGNHIDVHPDFLDPDKYFSNAGDFTVPLVDRQTGGFFFGTDVASNSPFDMCLPRPIYGNVCVGKDLLDLYRDENPNNAMVGTGSSRAKLADCFTQMMTRKDAQVEAMEKQMAETVVSYDSIDTTGGFDRNSLAYYGQVDDETKSYLIEPKQKCKDIQSETRRVIEDLIEPWSEKREKHAFRMNDEIRRSDGPESDLMTCPHTDDRLSKLREFEDATQIKKCKVMKDLITLHISRIEAAFQSKKDRETIPPGYNAMYDGLMEEINKAPNKSACCAFTHNKSLTADDVSVFAHIHMWIGQFFEQECFIDGRDRRIMDEIFLLLFEQYGDVTFLLLLCGYKGNGKSLRTERAMHVFPPNWVVAGGPSSAREGMNGDHADNNGKNVIYDEMIDDLCDPNDGDRLEYWKQIVLKREYVYQRTVSVKSIDGSDSHKTMKLKTPHDETHCACTNYGLAFTKDRDPSDTKFAMIDRSIGHVVRSIGTKARTDSEFKQHMSKPEQQRKLSVFRTFVCLVGATKLVIKGVPAFQPNLALANKIFDHLDNQMIVGEYNLPRRTPRKGLKREENLRTMTVMNAVAKVFMFRQTAIDFEPGTLDSEGKPPPFRWVQLYDVVRQLVPTPELIFVAWSQSLDYNIGTSAHAFAAMTSICEVFNLNIANWMQKPSDGGVDKMVDPKAAGASVCNARWDGAKSPCNPSVASSSEQQPDQFEHMDMVPGRNDTLEEAQAKKDARKRAKDTVPPAHMEAMTSILDPVGLTKENAQELLLSMERQRKATVAYRHRCAIRGNSQVAMMDPIETIENIMKDVPKPLDAPDCQDGESGDFMPFYASCIMASTVQVAMLHSTQSIATWMMGNAVMQGPDSCASIGTDHDFHFSKRNSRGAVLWNTAWMRYRKEVSGWMGFARSVLSESNCQTVKLFDLPLNGFRDLAFLLSTRDNSRRLTEDPDLKFVCCQENAFMKDGLDDETHQAQGVSGAEKRGKNANQLDTDTKTSVNVVMRKPVDSRNRVATDTLGFVPEWMRRHKYSMIPDNELQRRVDTALLSGRFPSMSPTYSNKVSDGAPLRIVSGDGEKKYVELNTSAALEHTKMMAEGVLRCSLHPGCQNTMERFCDDAGGPSGMTRPGKGDDLYSDNINKLSYSYDIMSIALTLDAMSRYYDDFGRGYCEHFNKLYGDIGLKASFETLPHMSMRFVGLKEEADRRLLSCKISETRKEVFAHVEAGETLDISSIESARPMVSISLGHHASDAEVITHLKSRAGARAMSGVSGDLFSMDTWVRHSLKVLKDRGMISGIDDPVAQLTIDDPYQLRSRVAECASRKINQIVDDTKQMKAAEEKMPGDEDLDEETLEKEKEIRRQRIRNSLYETINLNNYPGLDDLRHCGPLRIMKPLDKRTYHNTLQNDASGKESENKDVQQQQTPVAYGQSTANEKTTESIYHSISKMKRHGTRQDFKEPLAKRGGQKCARGIARVTSTEPRNSRERMDQTLSDIGRP